MAEIQSSVDYVQYHFSKETAGDGSPAYHYLRLASAVTELRARITQLEATEIELHRQLTLLKRDMKGPDGYETWKDAAVDQRLQVARLTAENHRLRADKERIDWQEANGSRGVYRMDSGPWFRPGVDEYYESFREGIDAARGGK